MKITLEMQAQEQGDVTLRECECHPNGSYKSLGKATLQKNGDAKIQCQCGRKYDGSWNLTFDPRSEQRLIDITNVTPNSDVRFDSYRENTTLRGGKS